MSGANSGARVGSGIVIDIRPDRCAPADADGHLTVEASAARIGVG